jgi:hypothetical protein
MDNIIAMPGLKAREEWAKQVYDAIMERAEYVAVLMKTPEQVETAYFNCDPIDKQELLGHMQIDIMLDVLRANGCDIHLDEE